MSLMTTLKHLFGKQAPQSAQREPPTLGQRDAGRLQQAIFRSEAAMVLRLLEEGVDPNLPDLRERYALCEAAEQGELDIVRILLRAADVNVRQAGKTPLYCAAATGRSEIVELLLAHGADANAANDLRPNAERELGEARQTPLLAAARRHAELYAAHEKDAALGSWLESEGARTPVAYRRCVEALLRAGANPLVPNSEGVCALDQADAEVLVLIESLGTGAKAHVMILGDVCAWREFLVGRLTAARCIVLTSGASSLLDDRKRQYLLKHTESCVITRWAELSQSLMADLQVHFGVDRLLRLAESTAHDFMALGQLEAAWQQLGKLCSLDESHTKVLFGLESGDFEYDVFISYKSQDSELARTLAEQLMSRGLSVWMAEYQILASARPEFQERINRGIARSKQVLLLSREAYANSGYCWLEMLLSLELCGPKRMLEVALDDTDHRVNGCLRHQGVQRIRWRPEASEEIARKLRDWFGLPSSSKPPLLLPLDSECVTRGTGRATFRYSNMAVSMEQGPWIVRPPQPNLRQNELATVASLSLPLGSGVNVEGKLQALNPYFAFGQRIAPLAAANAADDRTRLLAYLESFRVHYGYGSPTFECRGVHLMHVCDEGHPGYTYLDSEARIHPTEVEPLQLEDPPTLVRQCLVNQKHPISAKPVQLRFLFWLPTATHGVEKTFRDLFAAGAHLERLISTTRLERPDVTTSLSSVREVLRQNPALIIRRALAVMTLVQRAYTEAECHDERLTRQLAIASSRAASKWARREGLIQAMSSREQRLFSAKIGTWSAYDRHRQVNRQAEISVFLWFLGLGPRPIVTRNPEQDVYGHTRFMTAGALDMLVAEERRATAPTEEELVEFATACFIYVSRIRAIRLGDRRGRASAADAVTSVSRTGFQLPVTLNLLSYSGDGDLRIPLYDCAASALEQHQVQPAGIRCECQLRACDALGIPSPGAEFRAQYGSGHNLNRIAPIPSAVAQNPFSEGS